ncbi:MAG: biotin--[acetyl-CoA-carboxylase] ligase [Endomicrobium sp.]|jgi:BirA family biotin operon repressor/biotin-[acetyl-CoA-carboxylase] ligase|nr:biotin--[acetyl-CoA-carboxylase] ligase [Endomicrobium sp.]
MNIIEILSSQKCIHGNEIGRILGISEADVHKQINSLKQIGYTIKSSSQGYKLVKGVSLFNEYEIEAKLKKRLDVCKTIKYYKELSSTQISVKELAEKGFEEGVVVVAETQTSGYGRHKRFWSSNVGGLWFSILLKPSIGLGEASKLALLLSIVLNITLEKDYGISSRIKWPNDVLVLGKKLAGIIVEISAEQDMIKWVVAGIGININNSLPEDLENISITLKSVLKKEVDRAEFMIAFLTNFENLYLNFQKIGFKQFLEKYNSEIAYKNKKVSVVNTGRKEIIGVNLGIDEEGGLIIKTSNGIEKIISGTLRQIGE